MPEYTLIEAIRMALDEALADNPDTFIIGADVGLCGGVFRATLGLQKKYSTDRVIDTPLAEASIIGVGIGAALYGMRPICEIQFADFIHPAFNQIINEAARMCYRSNGQWNVPLVIRVPYGGGNNGGLYHSQSVEAYFTHAPGLKVVVPSNPYDARGLLKAAIDDPNPVIFLEPKLGYHTLKGEVPDEPYQVPIGTASITRQGSDITILTYGMMHHHVQEAAETVSEEGIDAEVVDLRTLYPVDRTTILQSVRHTNKALIVHEDNQTGGYGAEIAAILADEAFTDLDAPVRRVCAPDVPSVPFSVPMQEWFMPDADKIAAEIRILAAF
jgi:2-oxoisovalerate dehydrogenase E1 component beta subunit